MLRKRTKRSPIKSPPLPEPGEGLQWQIQQHAFDLIHWAIIGVVCLLLAGWEWARYWFRFPPTPWFTTVLALGITGYCASRIWRIVRSLHNLKLGLSGEQSVGQLLETLRSRGYHVFHDIYENEWNIDHVLIGPAGVFAIETKTLSKPNDHDAKVAYDGRTLLVDGQALDRDPITQAKASARRVRQILMEQTGQEVAVRPVVLVPGWFVESCAPRAEVCVSNENWFLKSFEFEHRERRLEDEKIKLLVAGMVRYQRRQ